MAKNPEQAGPLMKRVRIEGRDHILPADAKLAEPFPAHASEEEQKAWVEKEMSKPLGGAW
ncbi:hypothetical protein RMR10_004385 [Agrobacterium rosae]|uniref:hypothetical protein n=1 Tax=Agrobacterium rosae TaxID=1972867 RepID=UPI002A13343B|nr:hypothetical protein [Agrobacterium rosae]MDX8315640.1 hypothetical protein [Agrobacterium rosae]